MALFGRLAAVRAQSAWQPGLQMAFAHLQECLRADSAARAAALALAAGAVARTELGDGVFALAQAYLTKPRAAGRWESHRRHIDVQMLLEGAEFMEVTDVSRLQLAEDLSEEKDVLFYHEARAAGTLLLAFPGETAIYYPVDAHLGAVAVTAPALVRKIVVKVPVF